MKQIKILKKAGLALWDHSNPPEVPKANRIVRTVLEAVGCKLAPEVKIVDIFVLAGPYEGDIEVHVKDTKNRCTDIVQYKFKVELVRQVYKRKKAEKVLIEYAKNIQDFTIETTQIRSSQA